ncbi:MAG: hypothetical protein FJY98_01260 [Candidatus Liptonbacteria bacterium]|nr:hypothetical protein [Candidatus Liptonbacteria bacterium]
MNYKLRIILPILFAAIGISISGNHIAEAKDAIWSKTFSNNFYYYSERFPIESGGKGLGNPNVTIRYHALIKNAADGKYVADGSTIPVGTKLLFERVSSVDEDITWNGTGYSSDTPYGHFIPNAGGPVVDCNPGEKMGSVTSPNGSKFDPYVVFSAHPPSHSISHAGTAVLSCNADNTECTVTSPGTIQTTFNIRDTTGKFYYRYYDYRSGKVESNNFKLIPGCYGNNIPMSLTPTKNGNPGAPFIMNIPSQAISYKFNAVQPNRAPAKPVCSTSPANGTVDTQYTIKAQASDPDGDGLRYEFAFEGNTQATVYVPSTGYARSGAEQSILKQWASEGTKKVQVRAIDASGAQSEWGACDVSVGARARPKVQLFIGPLGKCEAGKEVTVLKNEKVSLCWKVNVE